MVRPAVHRWRQPPMYVWSGYTYFSLCLLFTLTTWPCIYIRRGTVRRIKNIFTNGGPNIPMGYRGDVGLVGAPTPIRLVTLNCYAPTTSSMGGVWSLLCSIGQVSSYVWSLWITLGPYPLYYIYEYHAGVRVARLAPRAKDFALKIEKIGRKGYKMR